MRSKHYTALALIIAIGFACEGICAPKMSALLVGSYMYHTRSDSLETHTSWFGNEYSVESREPRLGLGVCALYPKSGQGMRASVLYSFLQSRSSDYYAFARTRQGSEHTYTTRVGTTREHALCCQFLATLTRKRLTFGIGPTINFRLQTMKGTEIQEETTQPGFEQTTFSEYKMRTVLEPVSLAVILRTKHLELGINGEVLSKNIGASLGFPIARKGR